MPRIFDNITLNLLPALRETLDISERSDFCVGYFNLRRSKQLDSQIERRAGGIVFFCRPLLPIKRQPRCDNRAALSPVKPDTGATAGNGMLRRSRGLLRVAQ